MRVAFSLLLLGTARGRLAVSPAFDNTGGVPTCYVVATLLATLPTSELSDVVCAVPRPAWGG